MSWASLVLALVKAVGALTSYLHDRQLITAGQAIEAANAMKAQHDALIRANQVRETVSGDLAKHPDTIMRDDGFRRD